MKIYDVTGWPEISGDGVTDAYQIVEFYDDWAANATASIKSGATLIGRGRLIQIQKAVTSTASTNPFGGSGPIDGVYDMWFFDPQMWTALNITNPGTFTVGMRVVGKTSGSYGYVANIGAGTHYIYLEQVTGGFTNGEILEVDGRVYGTLEAAWTYNITDARSVFGKIAGTNNIRFGANLILNDAKAIEASTINVDDTTDDEITGFRTRFDKDLRPGDVVTPVISNSEGNNTHRILRVDPTAIGVTAQNKKTSVAAGDVIFNYDDETAKIDCTL